MILITILPTKTTNSWYESSLSKQVERGKVNVPLKNGFTIILEMKKDGSCRDYGGYESCNS